MEGIINILSINLDFLMPMLEKLKNIEINKKELSYDMYWEKIKDINKCDFKIDFYAKCLLNLILEYLTKYPTKIDIIEEHQEILNIVSQEEVNIVNIDQHHDIYYSFLDKGAVFKEEQKEYLESSWVYYLYTKNQLKSYVWITNHNARYDKDLLRFPFSFYIGEEYCYQDCYGYEPILEKQLKEHYFDKVVFLNLPPLK